MLKDRFEAGEELTKHLAQYRNNEHTLVLGLPRGGIVTAYTIAAGLQLPLDIIGVRKIGAPFNPELAVGAIAEAGEGFFDDQLIARFSISREYLDHEIKDQKKVMEQRLKLYRKSAPKQKIENQTVILVDDGLATGATMKAAIKSVRAEKAGKIVVAVPVTPPDTLHEIEAEADEVVYLMAPSFFAAVGQFYDEFSQVEDTEVIALLQQSADRKIYNTRKCS